jgi:adenosylcobinamide-GDP ribazoletransferase
VNLRTLAAAFSYFTIFPTVNREHTPPASAAFGYLPIVGIIIGAIAGWAGYGLSLLGLQPLAIACAFALPIVLTGALHVDGFLDSCDALFACVDPEQRLRILKDPHHGSFAIAYLAVAVAVWIAAIAMLPPVAWPASFALAGGIGRWSAAINLMRYPYAGTERFTTVAVMANAFLLGVLSMTVAHWARFALVPVAALSLIIGEWAARRLGGRLTGDVYGALIIVCEIATLTIYAALYGR